MKPIPSPPTLQRGAVANLKYDVPASVVVFLVALPLCLGIALASGAPLFSGVIAGIVGGIVVGALSGSPLGVSGPAAGLAVIVLSAISTLGAFDVFLLAVVVGGLMQIGLGVARAGVVGYYVPNAVIKGMLAAIGIIIALKQIPHAFGYDADFEGDMAFQQPDGENTFSELVRMLDFISPGAVAIAAVSLALLLLWETGWMKRQSWTRLAPGPLAAVAAGIGLTVAFRGIPSLALAPEQLVSIPIAEGLSGIAGLFTLPDFGAIGRADVWIVGATIAAVASIETLLCVEATDKLDPYKRNTPTNRELVAQGVGNAVSGLIGGLPVTQVIVRSSANIQSGGRTKVSAILHGVLLLVCVLALPAVLNLIPLASLAAVLLLVGYKLARPVLFQQMWAKGWTQFVPFLVTILGVVFTDLLLGVGMGLAVAVVILLYQNWQVPYHLTPEPGGPVVIRLSEHVSFFNKAAVLRALYEVPDGGHVVVDASRSITVDPDVREIVDDFRANAATRGVTVDVVGSLAGQPPAPVGTLHQSVALHGSPDGDGGLGEPRAEPVLP